MCMLVIKLLISRSRYIWGGGAPLSVSLFCTLFFPSELTALLSGNMSRVLEDYDALLCKELYSDDALPHISSSRSDAVSTYTSTYMYMYLPHDFCYAIW